MIGTDLLHLFAAVVLLAQSSFAHICHRRLDSRLFLEMDQSCQGKQGLDREGGRAGRAMFLLLWFGAYTGLRLRLIDAA